MKHEFEKIILIKLRKPSEKNLNADLQWLSGSLGLFGDRDKEKSCFRVFIEIVKATRKKKSLTSDEIALRSNLSRATVIHHLNKLIEFGLVIHHDNFYLLRTNNMQELVEEIRKDSMRVIYDLMQAAQDIDDQLGMPKNDSNRTVIDQ